MSTAQRVSELVSRVEKVTNDLDSLHSRLQLGAAGGGAASPIIAPLTSSERPVSIENFAGITERLGAVVKKVEHIENNLATAVASSPVKAVPSPGPKQAESSTPSAAAKTEAATPSKPSAPPPAHSPSSSQKREVVSSYEQLQSTCLVPFLEAAAKVGGNVATQAVNVGRGFQSQLEMLKHVAHNRPTLKDPKLQTLIQTTLDIIQKIDEFQTACEVSASVYPHLSMVAGGVVALSWVVSPDDPASTVSEMLNAIPTFGGKLMKGNENDAKFYETFRNLLRGLLAYVREKFPKGLCNYAVSEEGPDGALEKSLADFDDLLENKLTPFVSAAAALGQKSQLQAECVRDAFNAQRAMIVAATLCRPPTQAELKTLVGETVAAMSTVEQVSIECSRDENLYYHFNLVSGGISALGWVTININPVLTIVDIVNGLPVYSDKILQHPKKVAGSDEFVATFSELLISLRNYVRENHPKGLTWNVDGISVAAYLADN